MILCSVSLYTQSIHSATQSWILHGFPSQTIETNNTQNQKLKIDITEPSWINLTFKLSHLKPSETIFITRQPQPPRWTEGRCQSCSRQLVLAGRIIQTLRAEYLMVCLTAWLIYINLCCHCSFFCIWFAFWFLSAWLSFPHPEKSQACLCYVQGKRSQSTVETLAKSQSW